MIRHVIIADGDYIDRVAFDLTVNFERMLERRIPPADLALWTECVALDGGVAFDETATDETAQTAKETGTATDEAEAQTQLIIVHDSGSTRLANFTPTDYAADIDRKAFRSRVGEVVVNTVSAVNVAPKTEIIADLVSQMAADNTVSHLMIIPGEDSYDIVRHILQSAKHDNRKAVTVFVMEPKTENRNFRHEILGYSLMAALGVRSSEFAAK